MRTRPLASLGLAIGLAMTTSAATAQKDPFGVGREFGAYVNPAAAAEKIRACDAQTLEVESVVAAQRETLAAYARREAEYQRRLGDLKTAQAAVADAEHRLDQVSGPERERVAALLETRRQRLRELNEALRPLTDEHNHRQAETEHIREIVARNLRAAAVPEVDLAQPGAEIIRRQQDRCKRMRAWAELGRTGRLGAPGQTPDESTPAEPQAFWPKGAMTLWKGMWTCQRVSTIVIDEFQHTATLRATVEAELSPFLDKGGESFHIRLDTKPVPSFGVKHGTAIHSSLTVTLRDIRRGRFVNTDDENGDTSVSPYAVDEAVMSADGAGFHYERHDTRTPGQTEVLDCKRL